MKRIKICVTQDDIDKGIQGSGRYCPIALAVKRARIIPDHEVSVGQIYLDFPEKKVRPSRSAKRFIGRFDSSKPVKPFCFVARDFRGDNAN